MSKKKIGFKKSMRMGWDIISNFAFFSLLVYISMAFMAGDNNPNHWGWIGRIMFVVIEWVFMILSVVTVCERNGIR